MTFMDSTGIAALVKLDHALAARAGRLAIACPEGPARLLLDVTGLAELDCDPLIVTADGAVAVGARVHVRPARPVRPFPALDR